MINNYLLYQIINPIGHSYIGVTNNFNRRMSEHFSDFKNRKQNIALHNSFSKYGYENHQKDVILKNLTKETAYKIEELSVNYIRKNYKKISLNSRSGGLGGNIIDWTSDKYRNIIIKNSQAKKVFYNKIWDYRLPIILKYKNTHTVKQISSILNCSSSALCNYLKNNQINIKRKSKYNLQEIANIIKPLYAVGYTNKDIMVKTGYSKGTICRAKKLIKR